MKYFSMKRRVCFYETDAMGVVHHSNYFRFFEESRGGWVRENNLSELLWKEARIGFAVVEATAQYLKPALHNDEIEIRMQVRREGIRYHFRYAVVRSEGQEILVTGETTHVPLNEKLNPCRVPKHFNEVVERSPWTETWP